MGNIVDKIVDIYSRNLKINSKETAILRYGIIIALSAVITYLISLLLSVIFKNVKYVFIILLTSTLYRSLSGGAHCSGMIKCSVFSAILVNALGIFIKLIYKISSFKFNIYFIIEFIIMLYSLWAVFNFAPADTSAKPITSKEKRKKLKNLSFVFLILWYSFSIIYMYIYKYVSVISLLMGAGILWQSFSITPLGYEFVKKIDKLLSFFILE